MQKLRINNFTLAEMTGVTVEYIEKIRAGKKKPSKAFLIAIKRILYMWICGIRRDNIFFLLDKDKENNGFLDKFLTIVRKLRKEDIKISFSKRIYKNVNTKTR